MTYVKVRVRAAEAADLPVLFGMAHDQIGEGFADARSLALLERDEVYVAEADGLACGYVAVRDEGDALVVGQLFVAELEQGHSVGNQLLDWAEGLAISRGRARVEVEVDAGEERAIGFLARRGYRRDGGERLALRLPSA